MRVFRLRYIAPTITFVFLNLLMASGEYLLHYYGFIFSSIMALPWSTILSLFYSEGLFEEDRGLYYVFFTTMPFAVINSYLIGWLLEKIGAFFINLPRVLVEKGGRE